MVDLLKRAHPPPHLGGAAAERDQRDAVGLGGGDRAHPVGDAAPSGERADAGLARRLGPADRREGSRLLVPGVHDIDPLLLAAVVDGEEMAAGESEQLGGAAAAHRLSHQPPTVHRGPGLGLFCRHRGETTRSAENPGVLGPAALGAVDDQ
jgi:hypothetical protein